MADQVSLENLIKGLAGAVIAAQRRVYVAILRQLAGENRFV